jgi:hypothetical protein
VPPRVHLAADEVGDDLLVGRPEAEIPPVPVLHPHQFLAVDVPPPRFAPELRRRQDGKEDLQGAGPVHLTPDNSLDFSKSPEPEREIGVDTGRHPADHACSQHQAVADDLGLGRVFAQSRKEVR